MNRCDVATKPITLPNRYKKYLSGFYTGFSSGGLAYDADKITNGRMVFPKPAKTLNSPILIHRVDMSIKMDRKLVCALINRPHQKSLESNMVFLGTSNGEYDNTIYGWCQLFRERKCVSVLVYSLAEVIKSLQRDMNWFNALEYWEFNMLGSWMGAYTPIYFYTKKDRNYRNFLSDTVVRMD